MRYLSIRTKENAILLKDLYFSTGIAIDYMVGSNARFNCILCQQCILIKIKSVESLYSLFDSFIFLLFQHWQIPLSRRFRSMKLWFVIRNYGIIGLQKHIREVSIDP